MERLSWCQVSAGLLKGSASSLPEEMVLSAGSIEDVEVVEEGMCDWV